MALALNYTDYALLTTTTNAALASSGQSIVILAATVCKTDVSTHKVTIWRVGGGGTLASQPNMIWNNQPVNSQQTLVVPITGQTLVAGAGLFAAQDAGSGVNLNIGWAQL